MVCWRSEVIWRGLLMARTLRRGQAMGWWLCGRRYEGGNELLRFSACKLLSYPSEKELNRLNLLLIHLEVVCFRHQPFSSHFLRSSSP